MGILKRFSKSSRQQRDTPNLPDWDDTRWRSHLHASTIGTERHCDIYLQMINTDRKEAARLFKDEDDIRARQFAESSLRHKRIVAALGALSPLCHSLYQRSDPLAGYNSLSELPEPARSGIITIIFAAGRLQLSYLTETVAFLREQFESYHIDAIQSDNGTLGSYVNQTIREALSPNPPSDSEVAAEISSSVKEYFGISVGPASSSASRRGNSQSPYGHKSGFQSTQPTSAHSSELGRPQSPEFSASSAAPGDKSGFTDRNLMVSSSPHQRAIPSVDPAIAVLSSAGNVHEQLKEPLASHARASPVRLGDVERLPNLIPRLAPRSQTPPSTSPNRVAPVDDSDDALLTRYHALRAIIAV